MTFYKAINKKDFRVPMIPGTVTNNLDEAILWYRRYSSRKKNVRGAARHIKRGESIIIKFEFDESTLLGPEEFQRNGISEHERKSCWTSIMKQKAQINEHVNPIIFKGDM